MSNLTVVRNKFVNHFNLLIIFILLVISCKTTSKVSERTIETGVASWHGPNFNGKKTANGEIFNMRDLTAAHRTLPFNSLLRVQNLDNGKTTEVRINDRGPFAKNRIIDLSRRAAEQLDMIGPGTANVRLYLMNDPGRELPSDLKAQSFTIQIAAYESKDLAESKSDEINDSRVTKVNVDGKGIYRVYYGKYNSSERAKGDMDGLRKRGVDGFVKQLEN